DMTRNFLVMFFVVLLAAPVARAQQAQVNWVQIEAQPNLSRAQQSIRSYAANLQDVNGFSIGGGWYAIALGPYTAPDAQRVLQIYRSEGSIPRDSYIAFSRDYRQQFWPIGANVLNRAPLNTPEINSVESSVPEATVVVADTPIEPAEETPRQAREGERLLSREDRADLQIALKWAGFYDGAIDASFGRGTRGSMARWQEANSFEDTGILTTMQRSELMQQYNAVLKGLGLKLARDTSAGIEIMMPTDAVAFQKYEPPFAHYSPTGDIDARVLLISQEGDQNTLTGLYDIMQTLEIVPEAGPRTLKGNAFTLIGESALTISHTQAWLENGEIKGFSLVWPAGDEERRTRLLSEMQQSFARVDGVLDANAGSYEDQSIDLISGLEIRRPLISRSGFFVDNAGTVVTTSEVTQSCGR
ncbi:MAG: peptidoglycan-binding domain-containing protein, partial [Amylibacter sp.]